VGCLSLICFFFQQAADKPIRLTSKKSSLGGASARMFLRCQIDPMSFCSCDRLMAFFLMVIYEALIYLDNVLAILFLLAALSG